MKYLFENAYSQLKESLMEGLICLKVGQAGILIGIMERPPWLRNRKTDIPATFIYLSNITISFFILKSLVLSA